MIKLTNSEGKAVYINHNFIVGLGTPLKEHKEINSALIISDKETAFRVKETVAEVLEKIRAEEERLGVSNQWLINETLSRIEEIVKWLPQSK